MTPPLLRGLKLMSSPHLNWRLVRLEWPRLYIVPVWGLRGLKLKASSSSYIFILFAWMTPPLLRGLKRKSHGQAKKIALKDWMPPPLLRGLKPADNDFTVPVNQRDWMPPPLLRGLKPAVPCGCLTHSIGLNDPASIKRIETCPKDILNAH